VELKGRTVEAKTKTMPNKRHLHVPDGDPRVPGYQDHREKWGNRNEEQRENPLKKNTKGGWSGSWMLGEFGTYQTTTSKYDARDPRGAD